MSVSQAVSRAGLVVLVVLLGGCGGLVELDPTTSSIPSSAEAEEPDEPSAPEDGAWGTWQLLSVDGDDGRRHYDPSFMELDLHPDGTAYLWTCAQSVTGHGRRCPAAMRVMCVTGTIQLSGLVWRVQLTNKEGTATEGRGDITSEPSGDIGVKGEGVLPAGAHYRRVGAATIEGCNP